MNQVGVQDAKTHLSSLLDRVLKGETIVVCRHNKPVAELRPLPPDAVPMKPRIFGSMKGQISYTEDCFAPMTDEAIDEIDRHSIFPPKAADLCK